jgi:hypothetical protein
MAVSVTYNLIGAGWAECFVAIGDQQAHLIASYLDDALDSLLRAVVALLRGVPDTTARFVDEPGEYRWRFYHIEPDRVQLRILRFDECWSKLPDERGEVILDAQCRSRTLAGAILAAAQRVLREHGTEGYARQWKNHRFPAEMLSEIKRLLD